MRLSANLEELGHFMNIKFVSSDWGFCGIFLRILHSTLIRGNRSQSAVRRNEVFIKSDYEILVMI